MRADDDGACEPVPNRPLGHLRCWSARGPRLMLRLRIRHEYVDANVTG